MLASPSSRSHRRRAFTTRQRHCPSTTAHQPPTARSTVPRQPYGDCRHAISAHHARRARRTRHIASSSPRRQPTRDERMRAACAKCERSRLRSDSYKIGSLRATNCSTIAGRKGDNRHDDRSIEEGDRLTPMRKPLMREFQESPSSPPWVLRSSIQSPIAADSTRLGRAAPGERSRAR